MDGELRLVLVERLHDARLQRERVDGVDERLHHVRRVLVYASLAPTAATLRQAHQRRRQRAHDAVDGVVVGAADQLVDVVVAEGV